MSDAPASVFLYWIPLGANGTGFVSMNGRIYEATQARVEQRPRLAIYHTALEIRSRRGRYIVETTWPSRRGNPLSRGVVVVGPVFARVMDFTRLFRYEVRCWQDGIIADADEAIGGPQSLSYDPETSDRILDLAPQVPPLIWGRDASHLGEMWNSNSVISWSLARADIDMGTIRPPQGGRAPGWDQGVSMARRQEPTVKRSPQDNCGPYWT